MGPGDRKQRIRRWESAITSCHGKLMQKLSEIIDYRNTDFATPLCDCIEIYIRRNTTTRKQQRKFIDFMEKVELSVDGYDESAEQGLRLEDLRYDRSETDQLSYYEAKRKLLQRMRDNRMMEWMKVEAITIDAITQGGNIGHIKQTNL